MNKSTLKVKLRTDSEQIPVIHSRRIPLFYLHLIVYIKSEKITPGKDFRLKAIFYIFIQYFIAFVK